MSSGVIDSASEQPARASGISTVFLGLSSFAVSAMKWTPAMTMTRASLFAASRAMRHRLRRRRSRL
jgi:short-subunit dehydrogenase involved in D-alanine esterification of teichoic acids